MEERAYQQDAVRKIAPGLKPGARIMYQLPTGGGKTHVAIEIAKRYMGDMPILRSLYWLTHRDVLEEQSAERIRDAGLTFGVVSSPQRLFNAIKRGDHRPTPDSLLVADEAHHATAKTWERVIKGWPGPVLGLTATPWRLKKTEGFDSLFSSLIIGPSPKELIKQGALVQPIVKYPRASSDNPEGGRIVGKGNSGGDYSTSATVAGNSDTILVKYAIKWLINERSPTSRALVYACGVVHGERLLEFALSMGLKAALITGKTPKEERLAIMKGLTSLDVDTVINCEVVTEGADVPLCDIVLMVRPTKSLALYLQMAGRCLRPAPGKEAGIILDAAANFAEHGLPDDNRVWSLQAREEYKGKGQAPVRDCWRCWAVVHMASRQCPFCKAALGFECSTCGKYAWWGPDGPVEDAVCERCDEEAQKALFNLQVDTRPFKIKYPPEFAEQWGVKVANAEIEEGAKVRVTTSKGKSWPETITTVLYRNKREGTPSALQSRPTKFRPRNRRLIVGVTVCQTM